MWWLSGLSWCQRGSERAGLCLEWEPGQNRHLKTQEAMSAAGSNINTANCKYPGSCMSMEFSCSSFVLVFFFTKML